MLSFAASKSTGLLLLCCTYTDLQQQNEEFFQYIWKNVLDFQNKTPGVNPAHHLWAQLGVASEESPVGLADRAKLLADNSMTRLRLVCLSTLVTQMESVWIEFASDLGLYQRLGWFCK